MIKKCIVLISLITVVFTVGCSKDEEEEPGKQNQRFDKSLEVTIDSVKWEAVTFSATIVNDEQLIITGADDNGNSITISTISDVITCKIHQYTYPIYINFKKAGVSATYASNINTSEGQITISEISKSNLVTSGSFSVTMKNTTGTSLADSAIQLVSGNFKDISYTTSTEQLNTLQCSYNGETTYFPILDATETNGIIIIAGVNETNYINLHIPNDAIIGNHLLPYRNYTALYGLINNSTTPASSDNGSILIQEHNTTTKHLKGTFLFDANYAPEGDVVISVGEFDVYY